jgi:hypothetical protein
LYCEDRGCDCRRVLITVVGRETGSRPLATINYGWESEEYSAQWSEDPELAKEMAGAQLDPINPQSEHAAALLELFEYLIQDRAYVERLKRHYALFREAGGDGPPRERIRKVPPPLQIPKPRGRQRRRK